MTWNRLFVSLFTALFGLFFLVFWGPQSAFGQADTGSISGVVRDSSGGVLPNAAVTVTNAATAAARTVQTGANGAYTVSTLTPGIYNVQITASGFQPFNGKAEVTVGGQVTLDARLSVSNKTETIEVVAAGGTIMAAFFQALYQAVYAAR